MAPTNADLSQRIKDIEEKQDQHSEILTRLTTLFDLMVARVSTVEADAKVAQNTLIEIGQSLVRYEERDASTQKWIGVVISVVSSLIIGTAMFLLGYFIRPK